MAWLKMTTLLLDALVVLGAAWLIVRWLGAGRGRLESTLAWGLTALGLVVASGVLLGAIGSLGQVGFLSVHLLVLLALGLGRHAELRVDSRSLAELLRDCWQVFRTPGSEAWLGGMLAVSVGSFVMLAWVAEPVVFDALTYRLSRVAQWLQDGRIGVIATDDARLNYMPVAPDLMMAWLLAAQPLGFKAAALAQTMGGVLALGATAGLARLMGLGRPAAMVAALLLLGMPNVAPQFTSAYTDLFTTGVLAAAFFLWLRALQRGEGSWLGGGGAALALGAKGTVAYIAPCLLLVAAWLAWRHRAGWSAWRRTMLGGILAAAVFVGPSLWRNQQAYGGWAGPADFVEWHHGRLSREKLKLNLASAFAQLCEPNSQPPWVRAPIRSLGEAVIDVLPEADPHAFDGLNRRANLKKIYAVAAPDADVASTGVLLPVLVLLAAGTALLRRGRPGAELALCWAAVIAGLVLFMHARVQWHPYLFRFLVLAAPWLAALVCWWLVMLPRWPRLLGGTLLAVATGQGFLAANFDTYQSGWPAYTRPEQSFGYHLYSGWRGWSSALDARDEVLRPALAVNAPLAAFYRQAAGRRVETARLSQLSPVSAETAVQAGAGWLIVPAARFMGNEGRVMARTRLHDGDAGSPFSLAAYRALQEGEHPSPVLYRDRVVKTPELLRRELQIRVWDSEPVRIELFNSGPEANRFTLRTPTDTLHQEIGGGRRLWLEVALPSNAISAVTLEHPSVAENGRPAGRMDLRLLP